LQRTCPAAEKQERYLDTIMRTSVAIIALLALFAVPLVASASDVLPIGELRFAVVDSAGTKIAGVTVTLRMSQEPVHLTVSEAIKDGRIKIADADGTVQFNDVPTGNAYVRFELSGFLPQEIGPLPIQRSDVCIRYREIRVVLASYVSTCF